VTDATTEMTGAGGLDPSAPAVELTGITKRFGGIVACDQVDLTLHRGRIHGILGENGAGKSTLMKVLIGLVLPDAGSVRIDGEPRTILDPLAAAALGIAMVHQHFSLVDQLSVWENVALGEEGRLKSAGVRDRVAAISQQYGLEIDPDARVGELTAGLRQRVEIIKCLRRDPHILVFDEPTSVLTPEESEQLFTTLREVVALEGPSGGGKSTVADQIVRHLDPDSGRVLLDGRDVRDIGLAELRANVSLSTRPRSSSAPRSWKTCGTRAPDADDATVMRAVERAGLGDFVVGLPDGLGTLVGEAGRRLSAGERQRVAIARGLLADPAELVLDEATSALDMELRRTVVGAYREVMRGEGNRADHAPGRDAARGGSGGGGGCWVDLDGPDTTYVAVPLPQPPLHGMLAAAVRQGTQARNAQSLVIRRGQGAQAG